MKCDDHVRAFIAIDISDSIREKIIRLQRRLSEAGIRISWVKPDNIHLTLAFLGNIPAQNSVVVSDLMDVVSVLHRVFTCEIKGLGYFGREKAPRIVWAGFTGDLTALASVQADLFKRLVSEGISLDSKPFVPHLTIARIKPQHRVSNLVSLMKPYKEDSFGRFDVHNLVLYRSELSPEGPFYSEMHRSSLRP